jgi:hypothetical protein
MNYIKTLESISADRASRLETIAHEIEWLRQHLLSSKFQGLDVDGARKDWIATADVLRWIETVRQA